MIRKRDYVCHALLAVSLITAPAAADVTIWFDAQDSVIPNVGETGDVELWANFTDPVVAWGLDVMIDGPTVVDLSAILVGASWDETITLDGDGLAGLRFPAGLTGDVLLGTLTFTGASVGVADLSLGYGDEDEGFLLELGGLDTNVTWGPGTITVLPEPATLGLLVIAALCIGRRRANPCVV